MRSFPLGKLSGVNVVSILTLQDSVRAWSLIRLSEVSVITRSVYY